MLVSEGAAAIRNTAQYPAIDNTDIRYPEVAGQLPVHLNIEPSDGFVPAMQSYLTEGESQIDFKLDFDFIFWGVCVFFSWIF